MTAPSIPDLFRSIVREKKHEALVAFLETLDSPGRKTLAKTLVELYGDLAYLNEYHRQMYFAKNAYSATREEAERWLRENKKPDDTVFQPRIAVFQKSLLDLAAFVCFDRDDFMDRADHRLTI